MKKRFISIFLAIPEGETVERYVSTQLIGDTVRLHLRTTISAEEYAQISQNNVEILSNNTVKQIYTLSLASANEQEDKHDLTEFEKELGEEFD